MPSEGQAGGRTLIRVLLADDLPQIRKMLRRSLEKDGRFEIVGEATDGAEAVEIATFTKPDAMVLDLAMPNMDGMAAIPKILKASPHTKIVVLSGFVEMGGDVLKAGAHGFFEKSAPPGELALTIANLVSRDN
jgi:DNA-binding NarL/FixJ family response regulator